MPRADPLRSFGDDGFDIGGLIVAMKLTARWNGKVFYEYEICNFKTVNRLDDKLLEKPK
jgi:hypothetical protein